MHVAERFGDKHTTAACLSPPARYELAAPSTPPTEAGVLLTLDRIVGLSLLIDGYIRAMRHG
jgi:hypothetical protein